MKSRCTFVKHTEKKKIYHNVFNHVQSSEKGGKCKLISGTYGLESQRTVTAREGRKRSEFKHNELSTTPQNGNFT